MFPGEQFGVIEVICRLPYLALALKARPEDRGSQVRHWRAVAPLVLGSTCHSPARLCRSFRTARPPAPAAGLVNGDVYELIALRAVRRGLSS